MNEFWNETREKKLYYYLYPLTVFQYFGFAISAWRNMFAEQFFNDWIQMGKARQRLRTQPKCVHNCTWLWMRREGGLGSLKIHAHSKSVAYFRAPQGPFATRSNEHIQKFHWSACRDDDASLLPPDPPPLSCHAYPWGHCGVEAATSALQFGVTQSKSVTVCGCLSAPSEQSHSLSV